MEVESGYYLMRAYNAINTSEQSVKFTYQGVKFWREDLGFVVEYKGRQNRLGDIYCFDEFEQTILDQKRQSITATCPRTVNLDSSK